MSVWTFAILLTLALHYLWEIGQVPLFADFADIGLVNHAMICLVASLADLLIAAVAYLVTATVFRRINWLLHAAWQWPAGMWIAVGLVAAILIERLALRQGRWTYGLSMPTILGIGLSPILQWVFIPLVTLLLLRRMAIRPIPNKWQAWLIRS